MSCSLVVGLLLSETAFRVAGVRGRYLRQRVDVVIPGPQGPQPRVPHGFVPNATLRSYYDTDRRGYFEPNGSLDHVFNSAGWRDVEHALEKPDGTFRILGLGDSYLFGQGVRQEDICLTRLGQKLQERVPDVPIETINAGLSAYNTGMQLRLLQKRGLAYEPDLVILHFCLNDVDAYPGEHDEAPPVEFFRDYTSLYMQPDWLSRHSYFWSYVRQRWLRQVAGGNHIQRMLDAFLGDDGRFQDVSSALEAMAALTRARGIPLLVAIFPFYHQLDRDYPFQPIHDRLVALCESLGVAVVDLKPSVSGFRRPELWAHPTDQHPNEIAHGIAAQVMADFLWERPALFAPAGWVQFARR